MDVDTVECSPRKHSLEKSLKMAVAVLDGLYKAIELEKTACTKEYEKKYTSLVTDVKVLEGGCWALVAGSNIWACILCTRVKN